MPKRTTYMSMSCDTTSNDLLKTLPQTLLDSNANLTILDWQIIKAPMKDNNHNIINSLCLTELPCMYPSSETQKRKTIIYY